MGYKLIFSGSKPNIDIKFYRADSVADMNTIPVEEVEFGSECLVIDSGKNYVFGSSGTWVEQIEGAALPTVTAADNGKVLGVSNGAWGKIDVPEELPEVTAADNGKVLGVADGEWDVVEGGSGGSVGVLYALDVEPATTDPDIPEGALDVANMASPLGTSADAETPMSYADLVSFFNEHDVILVDRDGLEKDIVLNSFISDGVMSVQGVPYLIAALECIGYMSNGGVTRFGVMFAWSEK